MTEDFPRIAVIGSGMSGILAGIKLKERGYFNFSIYEKAASLGGTWRDNIYPGVACDIHAHLYGYSFFLNPDWRHTFATGPELLEYFTRAAQKFDVTPNIIFNTEITSATWENGRWQLAMNDGRAEQADVLISAVGRLHHPRYPNIGGLENFSGPRVHTARWDPTIEVAGKRIGIIGMGSSGTQIAAALAKDPTTRVTMFQRTPQYVLRIPNLRVPWWRRRLLKLLPFTRKLYYNKLANLLANKTSILTETDRSDYDRIAYADLDRISDPVLKRKMTPDYKPGCKRMVKSPDFHNVVQQPNFELVDTPIGRMEETGVRTDDGELHEFDLLVLATGFKVDSYMRPMRMTGLNGLTLDDVWGDGIPWNYRTVMVPNMPNFFMINGPYAPSGSGSLVAIAETAVQYTLACIARIAAEHLIISPKEERSRELLLQVRERAQTAIWSTGGCQSWYLGRDGVPLIDPASLEEYASYLAQPIWEDFDIQ